MTTFDVHLDAAGVIAKIDKAVDRARLRMGEHLLESANRIVPLEEGTLARSGVVSDDGETTMVSYSTPYALVQHEDMTLQHDQGRTAKYLERPMHDETDAFRRIITDELSL